PKQKKYPHGLRRRHHKPHHVSIGVASRPRNTMSNLYPRAFSGMVVSQSKAEISRLRARSSAVELKMGSHPSSGSPGKYICVTSRVANAHPKIEKWICAGRHALL